MPVVALVLAGGTGTRMGRPKQFLDLLGSPALLYSLRAFEECPEVARIYAVGDGARVKELAGEAGFSKYAGCALPGEARSLSTKNGLGLLSHEPPETIVLVHDGSRCLLTPDLIARIIDAALTEGADGVIPAVPVSDTIKVAEDGAVKETLDRSSLHAVQTPQAFPLGVLREVYGASEESLRVATDDASLVETSGGRVVVVPGEKTNMKLTEPADLILAEAILGARFRLHQGTRN